MDCWHREIERSKTEADVVKCAADFMVLWSADELGPVTRGWRDTHIETADDLERMKKWLLEDSLTGTPPLRELGDYFWHASARIREIRRV